MWKDQLRVVRSMFPNAQILVLLFLRRQDTLLVSHYAERLKKGGVKTIKELRSDLHLDHLQRIEYILNEIEESRICLFPFELCKGSLETSVISFLELGMQHEAKSTPLNTSLASGALRILSATNRLPRWIGDRLRQRINWAARKYPEIFKGKVPISENVSQEVMAQYATSNRLIETLFWGRAILASRPPVLRSRKQTSITIFGCVVVCLVGFPSKLTSDHYAP